MSQLPVVLASSSNNFVALPAGLASSIRSSYPARSHGVLALRIGWLSPPEPPLEQPKPMEAFVGWQDQISDGHFIQIPSALAECLNLKQALDLSTDFLISVSPVQSKIAARVFIDPVGPDDWEIMELHATAVEDQLLSQICVVFPGQHFPLWVHGHQRINMQVMKIEGTDDKVVRLARDTEVAVAPKLRRIKKDSELRPIDYLQHPMAFSVKALPIYQDTPECSSESSIWNNRVAIHPSMIAKLVNGAKWPPMSNVKSKLVSGTGKPVIVNISRKKNKDALYCTVVVSDSIPKGHVALSKSLQSKCDVQCLDFVKLQLPRYEPASITTVYLSPIGTSIEDIASAVTAAQEWQKEAGGGPLTCQGHILNLSYNGEDVYFMATVQGAESPYIYIDTESKIEWVVKTNDESCSQESIQNAYKEFYAGTCLENLGAVAAPSKTIVNRLVPALSTLEYNRRVDLGAPHPGGVYLCGGRGLGKTTLTQSVAKHFRTKCLAKTVWISCSELRGSKRSEIEAIFNQSIQQAICCSPSLIVFDDLDLLLPEHQDKSHDDAQQAWLAELLADLLHEYCSMLDSFEKLGGRSNKAISWIATGRSKRSLRSSLLRSGHFPVVVELLPLNCQQRTQVLESLATDLECDVDFDIIAGRAEGYAPADLRTLIERAQLNAHADHETSLRLKHLEDSLDNFTPAALRGVSLAKSTVHWTDVGGLIQVRQILKETLQLPLQFAALYDKSPQRLASGVLLYGPPGCGKTLLAGAVASECGLNFISVKGPEVLNKYIGASEQAVRDLFARAAAAAPCILFFDEFDAVAPRRGNDSSGVTDRVVNQLLTFLDGVEARSGVYVMAATSRPDLVDPALLRPGRLDKQLLCGFPHAEERLDILQCVGRKMQISQQALDMLPEISQEQTDLFTGADLQALLYSAQLMAVHSQLSNLTPELPHSTTTISAEHLKLSIADTRPSVSAQDRERYNKIYQAFGGDRGADFNAVSGYGDGKQRTALK